VELSCLHVSSTLCSQTRSSRTHRLTVSRSVVVRDRRGRSFMEVPSQGPGVILVVMQVQWRVGPGTLKQV